MEEPTKAKISFLSRIQKKVLSYWDYFNTGIWADSRRGWKINAIRTINLSINSFLNRDIQTQACAMTYRTMLAIVPALALLLAIGRGFGMQEILQRELFHLFPAQKTAIEYGISFVDKYLSTTSEGIFVGAGVLFLLWTLISLLGNMENTFNLIWGQHQGRTLWRKITDYTAMLLILPVLMICVSGLMVLLSSTLDAIFNFSFMTPLVSGLIEAASFVMIWLFFTAVYILLPNTKVKFKYAFISGILAGTGFSILQWLFVTGTLYVTRYNAVYGSVAFLPLMMLWLQLVWVITLSGAVVCYSSQNVFAFSLDKEVASISLEYRIRCILAMACILTQRFIKLEGPLTDRDFMDEYDFPARLVTNATETLCSTGICSRVLIPGEKDVYGYQLAVDPSILTVKFLAVKVGTLGYSGFIPNFDNNFPGVQKIINDIFRNILNESSDLLVKDININNINIPDKDISKPNTL